MQASRPEVRIQEAGVVEQQRAKKGTEGNDQEHHQADETVGEDESSIRGRGGISSGPLTFSPDVGDLLGCYRPHARRVGGLAVLSRV